MRKLVMSSVCCTWIFVTSFAQAIPPSRLFQWQSAGMNTSMPAPQKLLDFVSEGAVGDSVTPNDSAFQWILQQHNGEMTKLYVKNGIYLFNSPLQLPDNIIIEGESCDSVILRFRLDNEDHLLIASGVLDSTTSTLQINAARGDRFIEIADSSLFNPDQYIRIEDDDSMFITSSWAMGSTAQIARIDSIHNRTLFLHSPLRRNFLLSKAAKITAIKPAKNIGIQNLVIERKDTTNSQRSNIYFEFAVNCYVRNIESRFCNYAHIECRNSSNMEISDNFLHHGFDYGSGGKAYGVLLHFSTGECLVYRNLFRVLRHSILLQAGANGNVLAYNYSRDPFWTNPPLPSASAGDLVLHGNYPFANLFEGNTVQNIVVDDSHGANGPYNTFFRNRAELYGLVTSITSPSDSLTIVGNEITKNQLFFGNYRVFGVGHFEYGNKVKGNIVPSGTGDPVTNSLFMDSIPTIYQTRSAWPPIGTSVSSDTIQAELFYQSGRLIACRPPAISTNNTSNTEFTHHQDYLYPNPSTTMINLASTSKVRELMAINSKGVIVQQVAWTRTMNISSLKPGLYFLRIFYDDGRVAFKKFIKSS